MRRLAHTLATAALLLFVADAARADDDPRKKQAEPLFLEGLALHDGGRELEALSKFQRAYEIYPSPNGLFQIARSEQLLGRHLDAIGHYREALQSKLLHPKNAELGKGFVTELEGKLSRLAVTGPAGTKCRVGAREITLPLAEPLDVEPGDVVAACVVGGESQQVRARAVRGQLAQLEVRGAAREEPVTSPPPVAPTRSFWTTPRTLGVVAGGLAVVAGGVGGYFLVAREGHVSDGKDVLAATPQPCAQASSSACASYDDAASGVKSAETGAIVSFAAAGALAITSVVLLVWPETRATASVRVSPHATGLSLSGAF